MYFEMFIALCPEVVTVKENTLPFFFSRGGYF